MSNSDDDFDDDDELLLDIITGKTQTPIGNNNNKIIQSSILQPKSTVSNETHPKSTPATSILNGEVQAKLFQADGEIATLKQQLLQIKNQKQKEIQELKELHKNSEKNNDEQIKALKYAVQKLEDEKRFLNNELLTASASASKKRKLTQSPETTPTSGKEIAKDDSQSHSQILESSPVQVNQRIIKVQSDSSLLIDQLWAHSIIGAKRSSLEYLSKICVNFELSSENGFMIKKKTSINSSVIEFLMIKKDLRLDKLIEEFTTALIDIIQQLLKNNFILSVPFLLSLIYCSISFRPVANTKNLIKVLLKKLSTISLDLSTLLIYNSEDIGDINDYDDILDQILLLKKFIFICCLDVIEKLVELASQFEPEFIKEIWTNKILPKKLVTTLLNENSERLKNTCQINLVYNIVEMLVSSTTEETFGFNTIESDVSIINSLLKVLLIEITIKDGFEFYGLNRIIGNNSDYIKIESLIPKDHDFLNNYIIDIPLPIPYDLKENDAFETRMNHEFHLLNLRIKVAELLLSLIITKQTVDFLFNKEHFKSLIRVIGFEQNYISRFPRSRHTHLRCNLISIVIKLVNYLTQDLRDVGELIYTEIMYELFVVLSRIAFGADSLSIEAHKVLSQIRSKGNFDPIFNKWSEEKARSIHHLTSNDYQDGKLIANIESDCANGLEFPYESETVELAREILNKFVNHDEADNLYFNMNYENEDEDELMIN
ncbi:unnamed protein product [Candida verbasci]|uniref:DNA damage checkpoint protein LCD1 n=1 Tax=Candida verbasci TaxID=1227364 RepID=A0A9W4TV10_9ASCO|nr:unnamed protein product [Candida verbasci]